MLKIYIYLLVNKIKVTKIIMIEIVLKININDLIYELESVKIHYSYITDLEKY